MILLQYYKSFGTSSRERESPGNSIVFASFVLQEEIILQQSYCFFATFAL
jgi:hypothetical protein